MFNTFLDNKHISLIEINITIPELDGQSPSISYKKFVLIIMLMPLGFTDTLCHLEHLAIRLANDFLRPMFRDRG